MKTTIEYLKQNYLSLIIILLLAYNIWQQKKILSEVDSIGHRVFSIENTVEDIEDTLNSLIRRR